MEVGSSLCKSVKDCKTLVSMYLDDETKRSLMKKNMEPFFIKYYNNLTCRYIVEVEGKSDVDSEAIQWLFPDGEPDSATGHRGVTIAPNAKRPKICIPLSEIFELSIQVHETSEEKKVERNQEKTQKIKDGKLKESEVMFESEEQDFRTPRLIFLLLKAMSMMEVDGHDTEDILLSAVDLEPMAKIGSIEGIGLESELKKMGLDKSGAEQLLKSVLGDNMDPNKLMELGSMFMSKAKSGGLGSAPELLKMVKGLMGGGGDEEGDPEEQD